MLHEGSCQEQPHAVAPVRGNGIGAEDRPHVAEEIEGDGP